MLVAVVAVVVVVVVVFGCYVCVRVLMPQCRVGRCSVAGGPVKDLLARKWTDLHIFDALKDGLSALFRSLLLCVFEVSWQLFLSIRSGVRPRLLL